MWKVNDNDNNDDNEDDGQRTHFDQKSSLKPLGQVRLKEEMDMWRLCIKEIKHLNQLKDYTLNVDEVAKINVRLLHIEYIYPGLHPLSQCPFCLLQVESSRQLPLQLWTQLIPYVLFLHTTTISTNIVTWYTEMTLT